MGWDFDCPVCGTDKCVIPTGPKKGPILIVGDAPGKQEIVEGKPFVGGTGGVLRAELHKYRIDLAKIRVMNVWPHEPGKNIECFDYGVKRVLEEAVNKKVVLLIGSDTVKYFCELSVEEYNGLVVPSHWFPNATVMACMQPALVFHKSVGEIRFAISQFADLLRKENIL